MHLTAIKYVPPFHVDSYPFIIPTIRNLTEIEFTTPVTFFVGENGSGKSTLLEAIAIATRSITVGSDEAHKDETLEGVRKLANQLRLTRRKATRKGFFLRAEDYFGYAKRLNKIKAELEAEMRATDEEYARAGRESAKGLAQMAYGRELADLKRRYGEGLDARSHGESFIAFFQERFQPGGLYLLDEPEAPLSPLRQLGFLAVLKQMVEQDAQFLIVTHSPILMALDGATILNFDKSPVQPTAYDELEHVKVTKAFLNNPSAYLKHL